MTKVCTNEISATSTEVKAHVLLSDKSGKKQKTGEYKFLMKKVDDNWKIDSH